MLAVPETNHFALNSLLSIILQNYFENNKCVHYIINGSYSFSLSVGNSPMIVDVVRSEAHFELKICDAFVIQVDNTVELFKTIELAIKQRLVEKYSFRRYLFIGSENDVDSFASLNYTKNVFDLLLLTSSAEKGLYNLYYFENPSKGPIHKLVDKWCSFNKSFLLNKTLFPQKIHGQKFAIGTFNYPPYNILESMHGIELKILVEYCKRNQLLLEVVDYGEENWGYVFANGSGYGLMYCLVDGKCHVATAGFYWQTDKPKYFDCVMPVVKIGGNCIVPVPKLETSLLLAFLPFDIKTWQFVLVSLLTLTVVWKFSLKLVDSRQPTMEIIFTLLKLTLQQPTTLKSSIKENQYLQRLLVLTFVLMLLFSIAYPSQLFKLTSHPRYSKPIYNIDDLQQSGIKWGIGHYSYLDILPKDKYSNLFERLVVTEMDILLDMLTHTEFALVVEHLNRGRLKGQLQVTIFIYLSLMHTKRFVTPTSVNLFKLMTMKTDMFWVYGTMLLPLSSVWQPSLQKHNLDVQASGLDDFWTKEAFQEMGVAKYQRQLKASDTFELSKLSLWQIRGVFLVWGIGILISAACFVRELFGNSP